MKLLIAIFFSLLHGLAIASPVTLNEAADGDLGTDIWYLDLGVGINTITGTMSYVVHPDGSSSLDFDSFSFGIGEGNIATAFSVTTNAITNTTPRFPNYVAPIAYSFSRVTILNTSKENFQYGYSSNDKEYGVFELSKVAGSTIDLYSHEESITNYQPFSIDHQLTEGHYNFFTKYLGQGIIDYTFTIEVTPVPIPPSLWLMFTGILGLVATRKISR